jgi:curved DNA-binding protein CbpA
MGNTQSGTSNPNVGLYDQYINEQKRIIAAQQQQIQNLSTMYLNQTTQQNTPSNILLQQMNTNQNNHQQPIGSTNNVLNQELPRIENKIPIGYPNKGKLNPYKILGIGKNYDENTLKKAYLRKAMVSHPDRGGSQSEFQKVSIAYTVLLKKLSDKNNNHLHNDLRNNSQSYMTQQSSNNMRNTNMTDQFDINLFNKIYDENKLDDVYDKGYGDWMSQNTNEKLLEQPKMFNKSFNKDLFNNEFNKYKTQQQKQMGNQVVQYDEPLVDISMRGKDSLMVLGQKNVSDFSGQSSGGLTFRDYKDAFTNSCLIDESSVNLDNRSNNIHTLKSSRTNVNYKMSADDLRKQELIKLKQQKEEEQRLYRLQQKDNQASNTYERIHDRMLQR